MSGAAALVVTWVLLTVIGAGTLPLIGLTPTPRRLLSLAPAAPLTGTAVASVVGTASATIGVEYGWRGLAVTSVPICAAGAVRLRRGRDDGSGRRERRLRLPSPWAALAAGSALATIAVVGVAAVRAFAVKPLVEYDGWAIWGMKAQALAALGPRAAVLAGNAYLPAHLEYPPGLPAVVATPLQLIDPYRSTVVVAMTVAIGASGILALWGLLREVAPPALLWPPVAAIAATQAFTTQLGTGYADMPLAVLVAAGVVAAARWLLEDETPWLVLAGLLLAGAVTTKNEGTLYAAAVFVALLVAAPSRRRPVLVWAGAVALAALAPWRVFLAARDVPGGSDYDLSSSVDVPYVLGRAGRGPIALQRLLEESVDLRAFGLLFVAAVLGAAAALLWGNRRLGLFGSTFIASSLAGLTWIYVISPLGIGDYLDSSAARVVDGVVVGASALLPLLCVGLLAADD